MKILALTDSGDRTVYKRWKINFTAFWDKSLIDEAKPQVRHDIIQQVSDYMQEIGATTIFISHLEYDDMNIRWSSEEIDKENVHVWLDEAEPITITADDLAGYLDGDEPSPSS
jgi:hypothetical protein